MPPHSTVLGWTVDRKDFSDQYARAREIGYHNMADQLLEIADDGRNDSHRDDDGHVQIDHDVIARSRLRVDTRKWLLSKALPKVYGEKIDINARVEDVTPTSPLDDARRTAFHLEQARRLLQAGKGPTPGNSTSNGNPAT
jgi:hypothetical protein